MEIFLVWWIKFGIGIWGFVWINRFFCLINNYFNWWRLCFFYLNRCKRIFFFDKLVWRNLCWIKRIVFIGFVFVMLLFFVFEFFFIVFYWWKLGFVMKVNDRRLVLVYSCEEYFICVCVFVKVFLFVLCLFLL